MRYTVFGDWDGERYGEWFDTASPDAAEDLMLMKVAEEGGVFWPCAVVLGQVKVADTYAYYVDKDDPRHLERDDLTPVTPELEIAEWTVFGRVVSKRDKAWDARTGGERFVGYEMAFAPDEAEDVAKSRVSDNRDAQLLVVTVLPGRVLRLDSHVFCNRHELPAQRGFA